MHVASQAPGIAGLAGMGNQLAGPDPSSGPHSGHEVMQVCLVVAHAVSTDQADEQPAAGRRVVDGWIPPVNAAGLLHDAVGHGRHIGTAGCEDIRGRIVVVRPGVTHPTHRPHRKQEPSSRFSKS